MIRIRLLLPLCLIFSLSANAQWWKKKHIEQHLPLLSDARNQTFHLKTEKAATLTILPELKLERSQFSYDMAEAATMKSLYHTLRFHMYAESVDSFNILIKLYLEQGRYSEAKWYLLQINYLAHQQNDSGNIIASLSNLAMVKSDIGEFTQARQDLQEANEVANATGRFNDQVEIKKKLALVEQKRLLNVKNDLRYAELPEDKKN